MSELRTSYCKRCKAIIIFIRTERGKMMPCDPNPVMYRADKFGETAVYTLDGRYMRCTLACTTENYTGLGYKPHWGTCVSDDSRRRYEARQQPERTPPRTATGLQEIPVQQKKVAPKLEEPVPEQLTLFKVYDRTSYKHPI